MADIRYVALSDLHFGAATSLLTNLKIGSDEIDGTKPSQVLVKLVECLCCLIQENNKNKSSKPILILNGDLLELALADDQDAAMAFERFIDLIMGDDGEMFEQIIFIPGNHDHHLWETARETQYVQYISANKKWRDPLESPWHTTHMFSDPVMSYFLTSLIRRRPNLKEFTINTYYPNYGLLSADRKRCLVFHHGHFVESVYRLVSTLKTMLIPGSWIPSEIWNLEAENFAWIDFFWSTLGRSGAAGRGVDRIYEKLQNEVQFKKLLANLAESLAQRYGSPKWADRIEAKALDLVFNWIYDHIGALERNQFEQVLSTDSKQGLSGYMDGLPNQMDIHGHKMGPLPNQMADEKLQARDLELTFIFGHTHKPFQGYRNFRSFPGPTKVYNSGCWVVDTVEREKHHGGAVILIDDNLECTSLRMYNESSKIGDYVVKVEEATHPGDPPGPFHQEIEKLVHGHSEPWKSFSQAVAQDIIIRAQYLQARIDSPVSP